MNDIQCQLFDLTPFERIVYDYFMLISPPHHIKNLLRKQKYELNKLIRLSSTNLYSIAHVSFFKVWDDRIMDDYILSKVQQAARGFRSFNAQLNGIEIFSHGNTRSLVHRFADPDPIIDIDHSLRLIFDIPREKFFPHITIARSIPFQDCNKILSSLISFEISQQFLCDKITILRREVRGKKGSSYQHIGDVPLLG